MDRMANMRPAASALGGAQFSHLARASPSMQRYKLASFRPKRKPAIPLLTVSQRIANNSICGSIPYFRRSKVVRNCEKPLQPLQSHCRGQGFSSPNLHQPRRRLLVNAPSAAAVSGHAPACRRFVAWSGRESAKHRGKSRESKEMLVNRSSDV